MPNRVFAACLAAALFVTPAVPAAAQSPDERTRAIVDSAAFKQAAAFIKSDQDRFVRELVTLTEIPAPPFKEQARAKAFLEMLRQPGLSDVEMDAEGNVMGIRRGTNPGGRLLLVNAHLDTVFPEGTDVKVRRDGTKLMAPGIGDDTRGLALILALIRAMDAAMLQTADDILFAGNVGEEGEGDLRGIKFLLSTQEEDGSWYTRTRALAFQPYFDAGFPHEYDQWMSSAATSWAAMALTLALPESGSMTNSRPSELISFSR